MCRYNLPCCIWAPWLSILPVSILIPKRHHWRLGNPLGSGAICHYNYLHHRGWSHKLPPPSQPEPPDIRTSQHVCLWLSPLHNCSTWSSVTRRLSRVVPKIPDVWFPSLSQVLKVVQSQTVSSFSRWPLATTLWNVVTNKHKCFTVTNLPVVLKALQKYVLVQSLELPGHLYQRHLDYLEDMVSALKPYFKIEKGIFL